MKEIAFRKPSVTQAAGNPCGQILLPYWQTHFKSLGHAKIIVFMSPPSQDSDSCRNKNVVEKTMGGSLYCIDCIWLICNMVCPWFTQLFCWKTYKSRQGRDTDSWKPKNWRTEQKYCQKSIVCVSFPAGAVGIKVLPLSFRLENGQDSDTCPNLYIFDIASLAL